MSAAMGIGAGALIGGGVLVNSIGQYQGLRAMARQHAAEQAAAEAANSRHRELVLGAAEDIVRAFTSRRSDPTAVQDAVRALRISPEMGGLAVTMAQALQSSLKHREQLQGYERSDRMRQLGLDANQNRRDFQRRAAGFDLERRAAGMRGAELRNVGNMMIGGGQAMATHATPQGAATTGADTALMIGSPYQHFAEGADGGHIGATDLNTARPLGARPFYEDDPMLGIGSQPQRAVS